LTLPALCGQTASLDWQTHMRQGKAALVSGNLQNAEREFYAVLQTDAGNVEAHANLGSIYYLEKLWKKSAKELDAAITQQPELWKARTLFGLCNRRLGDEKRARAELSASLPHLESGAFKINAEIELVESFYKTGDLDNAQIALAQAQRDAPRNADVLYIAYRIHSDLANLARDQLRLAAPNSGRLHQLTAQHLVNRGDLTGAIREYQAALLADPHLPGIHYELGEAMAQQSPSPESLHDAETQFRAAINENPSDANAEAQLGLIEVTRSNFEAATAHFGRAFQLAAENALAAQGMGKTLVHMNRVSDAIPYLEKAVQANPENAAIHYQLAAAYRKEKRAAEADHELKTFQQLRNSQRGEVAR
jgi:tetratricopeptide (TPR) repeat protein